MATSKQPSFEQVQREVTGYALALAVLVEECVEIGAGKRMLGLGESESFADLIEKFDPTRIRMARHLSVYYDYAYDARVSAGHDETVDPYHNLAEHLRDFAAMVHSDGSYFDLCLDVVGIDANTETGFLPDMIVRWEARHNLESGSQMNISEIALLADMNERSVRNAASAEGGAQLNFNQDQTIENHEARRWLSGRRAFKPTIFHRLSSDPAAANDQLSSSEIPAFIAQRLLTTHADSGIEEFIQKGILDGSYESAIPAHVENTAASVGLAPTTLARAMHSPLQIAPKDCEAIAKAIRVEPVWFTLQVMQALFPKPMDMLLNPASYRQDIDAAGPAPTSEFFVTLSSAMIEHGYLDFPISAKGIFPSDGFGTRAAGDVGGTVVIRYGGHSVETDIRQKSELTLSPRKRFGLWFKSSLNASPGDKIAVKKLSERVFELSYIPVALRQLS